MRVRAYDRDLDLPPNGYCGWSADGSLDVWSRDCGGGRADYADTPAYLYIDGRHRFARAAKAAGNGIGICRILPGGYEILLHERAECGFAIPAGATTAQALAADGRELVPARLRRARGLTYVVPVDGAFSYRLTTTPTAGADPALAAPLELRCERQEVRPGENVTVHGKQTHPLVIPAKARNGDRLWFELEGAWIDFTVKGDG
jgi:hypothetical protein